MLIQRILNARGKNAQLSFFASRTAVRGVVIAFLAGLIAGCGGGSSNNTTTVAQVTLTPDVVSLIAGQVVTLSPAAVNSQGLSVSTTFTFNSSNTTVANISPAGQVCGGVWDSTFVVCSGNDAHGNPISGTATITATAQSVSSGPVSVTVHPSVTSVTVDPAPAGCFSNGETHQFVAHAFHNGTEVTSQVGSFSWNSSDATVAPIDTNGLVTAKNGGIAGIVATVGSTVSPATPFQSCMPVRIILHVGGDPAGAFTFSAVMNTAANNNNTADTRNLQVDIIDEKGTVTGGATLPITSNNALVASMAGTTLTANSPGGAGMQAVCLPPTCGNGINAPVYSNVFNVTVKGTSPTTNTIWVASSFPVPTGQIMPLVPIDPSQTPPLAGTPLGLPGVPNSIVFDRAGDKAYIGTTEGLAVLNATAKTVTLVVPQAVGKVLGVSADGSRAIVSNAANDPSTGLPIEPNSANQRMWLFDGGSNTFTTFLTPGAVAATFDDDGFRAYIFTNNGTGTFFVFSPSLTFQLPSFGDGSNSSDATTLASGPFAYVANSAGLRAISTCNNTVQANVPTQTSNIQFVGTPRNQDQLFAVDSTGVDVETVTVTPLTPPLPAPFTAATCTPHVSYSNQFFDFGVGAFTANQLLVSSTGVHAVVLPKGIPKVFTVLPPISPGVAQLPAGTEALAGGLTLDGNTLWVGVAGSNTVDRINLGDNIDEVQIPMKFVKVDGTPAPPNLVAVQPQ